MLFELSFSEQNISGTFSGENQSFNECNRMITYNGHEVLYDADGNMTYGPLSAVEGEDDTFVHFEYDSRNRLTKAGDTSYIYDAENNRIGVSTPSYTETYVVDDNCTLSQNIEISRTFRGKNGMSDTTVVEKYYYGNGLVYETTQPTENSTDDNLLVYHFNHLGSSVAVTNETGEILGDFSYGTYGELLPDTTKESTFTPRFLYNGQMGVISDANGLVYMRSRYYNPTIKRFINRDVLTGNIGNNKSLNQYCYVEGNPVSFTDPFGLNPYAQALGALHSTFREAEMFVRTIASPLVHTALDILGALPGGAIFDFINAGLYYAEGNKYEARKSIIFAIPGLDLIGKAGKLSVKGTKLAKAGAEALQVVDKVGKIGSIYFSAKDFGNDIAHMIDKYMVEGQEFSLATVLELAELGGHAFQLDAFTKPYMTRITGEDVKAGLGKAKDWLLYDNGGFVDLTGNGGRGARKTVASDLEGVRIVNKKYAGTTYELGGELGNKYPKGVEFGEEGFPNFEPYSINRVVINNLEGDAYYDFIKANNAAGYSSTPEGFTWHHVEDGKTLLLVPRDLHEAVRHTGGASLIRKGLRP